MHYDLQLYALRAHGCIQMRAPQILTEKLINKKCRMMVNFAIIYLKKRTIKRMYNYDQFFNCIIKTG
jgi:hypothetical protein